MIWRYARLLRMMKCGIPNGITCGFELEPVADNNNLLVIRIYGEVFLNRSLACLRRFETSEAPQRL